MVGTARDRLEAGAGAERKIGGGGRNIHKRNYRENNGDDGDGDTRIGIGKGNGGGGVTGGQWLQWGGMERGVRLRHTLLPTTGDTRGVQVAN